MKRKMRSFWLVGSVGIVLLIAILCGGVAFMQSRTFAKMTMPPDRFKEYDASRNEPLTFSPEEMEAKPFSEATDQASKAFEALWLEHGSAIDAISQKKDVLTPEETLEMDEKLARVEPLLTAFEHLVAQPDYELDALLATDKPGKSMTGVSWPDYLSAQKVARALRYRSRALSRAGRHADAFDSTETIVRGSKVHPSTVLIGRLFSAALLSIGSKTWLDAVENCDEPAFLRQTLARQEALVPKAVTSAKLRGFEVVASEYLSIIRTAKRHGIESDVQGMTALQIGAECNRVQAEYIEQKVLPTLEEPSEIAEARRRVKQYRSTAAALGGPASSAIDLLRRIRANLVAPTLFKNLVPDTLVAPTRDTTARALFDLLRLRTAAKIYRLERGSEPESHADLVPDYLPELPTDLFAEGEKPYGHKPTFYSIGPDAEDQQGALRYDPTNGTLSAGDLFLE